MYVDWTENYVSVTSLVFSTDYPQETEIITSIEIDQENQSFLWKNNCKPQFSAAFNWRETLLQSILLQLILKFL